MNSENIIALYLRGRLGNRMFQLALGHILAKSLERTLYVDKATNLLSKTTYPQIPCDLDLNQCEIFQGQIIDLEQLKKAQRLNKAIVLGGWFQRYSYYAQHKETISNMYRETLFRDIAGGGDLDIVFHLRTTDYRKPRVRAAYINPLPLDYLMTVYYLKPWETVYIITDDINDELVLEFQSLTNGHIISNSQIDDFNFIRNSKNIVLSTSTFSWWAAWLSEATTIFFLRMGIWNPLLRPDVDLKVTENRYNYRLGNNLLKNFYNTEPSKALPKSEQLRKFIKMKTSNSNDTSIRV